MQFNSNRGNNSNQQQANTNTKGIQLYNAEGFDPSTLVVSYWNQFISIKLHPALEQSKQTDSKRFDYENVVSAVLTLEKIGVLSEKIQQDILPAFKEEKELFKGVLVGTDSVVGLGTKKVGDKFVAYLAIFKSLDDNTKKPETSIYYEFKTSYTVDNYEPETGKFDITNNVPSELMMVSEVFKAASQGLTNAFAHAADVTSHYYRNKLNSQIEEIGAKHGIQPKEKGNWGGASRSNYRSSDVFGGGSGGNSASSNEESADTMQLSNMDTIDQFM